MNRRQFIKTSTAAALGANIIGCSKHTEKPNLLFIWTDEQRADTMKVYGNKNIHAPNLNKLASESLVFRNAYVSQPVCTPSRSTVMTGLWPHNNGCTENNLPLSMEIPVLSEMVDDPEYRSAYMGKWHLGDEIFNQHGFDEWISIEDNYRKYYRKGRNRNQLSDYGQFLQQLGYEPDNNDGRYSRSFASGLPLEHCKPKFLESRAIDFLQRNQNNPFMLYINFLEPHPPFFGPMDNHHSLREVQFPVNFDDPLEEDEPLWYRIRREILRQEGSKDLDLRVKSVWHNLIQKYWGLVTQVDLSVGAILGTLENLGLADNTIVVFTSDHGDMMGSHRLLHKTVMYQESVQVPWLMRVPQMGRRQNIVSDHVSHIDLVPTLLDFMNKGQNENLPGTSLRPVILENEKDRDAFIEWNPQLHRYKPEKKSYLPGVSVKETNMVKHAYRRAVITQEGFKLVLADQDGNQLYDLNKDPFETTNLVHESQYRDLILRHTKKITDWQQRTNDDCKIV
ncbi:sulfatase-like hydrolase/transferase [candidate division KSB1 bacterium]|nr:sulfatase-like hydrolase/transferase [candidate division KSB1 bacterium]